MTDMLWLDAIVRVLKESDQALSYTDIASTIANNKFRTNVGSTPAKTVSSVITTSIKNNDGVFIRTGRGIYWLAEKINMTNVPGNYVELLQDEDELPDSTGLINAFGMFWERDAVIWSSSPKLLGQQELGSSSVDFCQQIGVYLLYDGSRVIYVGRVSDQTLGRRLYQHTKDRLQGRWNRFSWFGLYPVKDDSENIKGELDTSYEGTLEASILIETLEAILIEGLEPPQNRRRGDNFKATEFLQVTDPEINKGNLFRQLDVMRELILKN